VVDQAHVTALILAGGQGQRMGGKDKGWVRFEGRALIEHAIECVKTQTDSSLIERLLISANRSIQAYEALGFEVLRDELPTYEGPLAGIVRGLEHCQTPWVFCTPCDTPRLPSDLLSRLLSAVRQHHASLAYVRVNDWRVNDAREKTDSDAWRAHPLCCLIATSLAPSLRAYLQSGQRKVLTWMQSQHAVTVDYANEDAAQFVNINALDAT
jgi:molybdopterin-guanine dinucleotide biosynthesis protein A